MNNIEELKPCPFCGGKAHLLTSNGSFLVECPLCLTDFLNGPVGIGWYRSEKDAAADWNDRPSERALIAQLEAAQKENGVVRNKYESMSTAYSSVTAELAKAEAELSAANEKLAQPVVLSSSTVMSRACAVRAIKAAGFTVEGE